MSRRFAVAAGGVVADRGAPPAGARFIGTELLELGQRDPEVLAGFEGGTVRWRSPLDRHFPHGHSTDEGWHVELYRSAGVHVGSIGTYADGDATKAGVDLSKAQLAAIRAADGSSAWRTPGTNMLCYSKIELGRPIPEGTEPWPVRCRMRGILHYDPRTEVATYEDLDVIVEGFDVMSGATTWSVPLGAAETFMEEDRRATPVGGTEVLVQGAAGPLIIDISNGASRPAAPGEAFWCAKRSHIEYRESRLVGNGSTSNLWRGGTLLYACAGDGSPTANVPRSIAPSLGAKVGERTVVATADRLVAYDPPAPAPA